MKKLSCKVKYTVAAIIVVTLTLGIVIVIKALYRAENGYITHWQPADILAFYGSYLSFFGTIFLGAVAICQNKKAQDLNQQLQKLQQAQYISMVSATKVMIKTRSSTTPQFENSKMQDINVINLVEDGFGSNNCYHIDVEFKNDSEYPIVQMQIRPGERTDADCLLFGMKNLIDQAVYIAKGESACFRYIVPCENFEKTQKYGLRLNITFINVFDYATPGALYIPDLQDEEQRNAYQYRLSKFTDVRPSNL